MKPKHILEEVRQILLDSGYKLLSNDYKNCNQKLLCISPDGYKVMVRFGDFNKSGRTPTIFHKGNPYVVENIHRWLMVNNKSFTLLSKKYEHSHALLTWKCNIDGTIWDSKWDNIYRGKGCPVCGTKSASDKRRLSIDDVKSQLEKLNPSIEILSTQYINNNTALHCQCNIEGCGYEWHPTWINLRKRHQCPECSKKNKKVFNTTLAEENKTEWLNKPAVVYIIKCFNDIESFYKIGFTTRGVQERFGCKKSMPYNYEVINEMNMSLYDAIYIENKLHNENKDHSYKPNITFPGHTECFSKVNI